MWLLRLGLLALCLVSCAVKNREPLAVQSAGRLPPGVQVSRGQKFLVRGTPQTLLPGEENTVTFQILDGAFLPVDLSKSKISIHYVMPTMPQMGVFRADAKALAVGKWESLFDIVHGGLWRVTIQIIPEGQAPDELVFEYDVK